jgi:flagellar basal body rod protein FlgG
MMGIKMNKDKKYKSFIEMASENIFGINTNGYEGVEANFSTLVVSTGASASYTSGDNIPESCSDDAFVAGADSVVGGEG